MDPISGVGLAANVLQFVDFCAKLVSKGNAIFKSTSGTLEEHAQVETVSRRLQELARDLETSISSRPGNDEQHLVAICQACVGIAGDLRDKLSRLTVMGQRTRFKSFRQALKSVWQKEELEALTSKLQLFRGELNTSLLVSMRQSIEAHTSEQSLMFDSLQLNQNNALRAHLVSHGLTNHLVASEHEKTRREIIDAIFEMAQWGLTAKYSSGFSVTYCQAKEQAKRLAPIIIVESLMFPMQEDRFEAIPEAYQTTFEWVWERPNDYSREVDNMVQWLESGDGLFWISGKAGSGKSTLLKYICDHTRARQHLSVWAGTDHLVFGRFFFWRSGSSLQRSQLGLLRSLIYCALHQNNQLIKEVLKDQLEQLEQGLADHLYGSQLDARNMQSVPIPGKLGQPLERWSYSTLEEAFRKLISQNTVNAKLVFFVDGLDEYEGDHAEIVDVFKEVVLSRRVKVCVSSRPLNVYERAFQNMPGFRVQDLTENDIRTLITGKLEQNTDMKRLVQKESERAHRLIQEIVDKASGVFLWVRLVVKSLLDGLANHDTMLDLERRLELLPPDLEDLYHHMISKIDPLYRPRASKFFQIVSRTEEPPLSLILSLADEEDPDLPITAAISPMNYQEQIRRIEEIEARIRNVCAGLLEVHRSERFGVEYSHVQFMHRTVLDFCDRPDVKAMLRGLTTDIP